MLMSIKLLPFIGNYIRLNTLPLFYIYIVLLIITFIVLVLKDLIRTSEGTHDKTHHKKSTIPGFISFVALQTVFYTDKCNKIMQEIANQTDTFSHLHSEAWIVRISGWRWEAHLHKLGMEQRFREHGMTFLTQRHYNDRSILHMWINHNGWDKIESFLFYGDNLRFFNHRLDFVADTLRAFLIDKGLNAFEAPMFQYFAHQVIFMRRGLATALDINMHNVNQICLQSAPHWRPDDQQIWLTLCERFALDPANITADLEAYIANHPLTVHLMNNPDLGNFSIF